MSLLHLICFSLQLLVADMLLLQPPVEHRLSLLGYVMLKHGAGLVYTQLLPLGCLLFQVKSLKTS
jgi:hypothetical protein